MASQKKHSHAATIVAIGASAGGLKAFERFFRHMPPDSGMAFVLIQHLDPHHSSELAELLQNYTTMPVRQAEAEMPVEANHVYTVPPNRRLTLAEGRLRLAELKPVDGNPMVIDHFFRSLADDQRDKAIGIVLSGTGSDGTEGLMAIKEQGGITLAQDEQDAEYSAMPRSAAEHGQADLVLPAAQMPTELLRFKEHALTQTLEPEAASPSDESELLRLLFVHMRSKTGQDLHHYKPSSVLRRITRRMQLLRLDDLAAYLARLRQDEAEPPALLKDLLIGVTQFFRDPEAFAELSNEVIPKLFEAKEEDEPVRIWVPACATGEEAYSLAILLAEHNVTLPQPRRLQLFASDINEAALSQARRGSYSSSSVSGLSPERLRRFFDRDNETYRVKRELRDTVLFARQHLIRDAPFSNLDLVSCRNLLIYLQPEVQLQVLNIFHFALRAKGYLFLGVSESLGPASELFAVRHQKARIFQRRDVHNVFPYMPRSPNVLDRAAASATKPPQRHVLAWGEVAQKLLIERFAPPCAIVDHQYDIVYISGRVGRYLEPAVGEASQNILQMARDGLKHDLRSALHKALVRGEGSQKRVVVRLDHGVQVLDLSVEPLRQADPAPTALVVFKAVEGQVEGRVERPGEGSGSVDREETDETSAIIEQLESELKSTRENLQLTVGELELANEELRASNEELLALNEEQQATTEELQTSQEELQSTNEELVTINQELTTKIAELVESNSDLNNLIASTRIATIFLDSELRLKRYTPTAENLFNLIPTDLGRPFDHLSHKLAYQALVSDAEAVLRHLDPVERELTGLEGGWYLMRAQPYFTEDDRVEGVVLAFIDISDRKRAEQAVAEAKIYAESIVESVREPLVVLDGELKVVSANRPFYETFQLEIAETERQLFYDLDQRQWDIPELVRLLERVLFEDSAFDNFEMVFRSEPLGARTMLLNARPLHHEAEDRRMILLAIEDISERKALELDLEHQANHDLLTGLANRRSLEKHFEMLLSHRRRNQSLALIFMDLDQFKQVNDRFGHDAGDMILGQVARRLQDAVRSRDLLARMGGDEFAVLLANREEVSSLHLIERVLDTMTRPFEVQGERFELGISIGVAFHAEGETNFSELLRRADQAMYRSKSRGGGFHYADTATDKRLHLWSWLAQALPVGLRRQQLLLYFQPVLDAKSGGFIHAEALLRWHHPERGFIPTREFIPVAEANGYIVELDRWVIKEALRQAQAGGFTVSVNLTSRTLQDATFLDYVAACLEEHDLEADRLGIEVTERVLAHNEAMLSTLTKLSAQGVKLAIDDFGTGYSSLTYLQHFPFDSLKLDQHFVRNLGEVPKVRAIAETVFRLANNLDLLALAEGVETEEQHAWVQQAGADQVQGELFAPAMPFEDFLAWMQK